MSEQPPLPPDNGDIKALAREAIAEQRDQLKRDLLKEIRSEEGNFSIGKVAAHPAFLLFIGFILTGIIGTLVTSTWQRKEWNRQQDRLVHIRRADQQEKVMEELVQAIVDSNETEENVLIAFSDEWRQGDPRREQITEERLEAWKKQGGRDWRIAKEMIRSKLKFYFTEDREVQIIFQRILDRRDEQIAPKIYELESEYRKNKNVRADPSFIKSIELVRQDLGDNNEDLQRMLGIILAAIQREVRT